MKTLFKNLKFKSCIFIIIGIAVTSSFLMGLIGYQGMKKIDNNTSVMYKGTLIPITDLTSIRADFLNLRIYLKEALYGETKMNWEKINEYKDRLDQRLKAYESSNIDEKEKEELGKFKGYYSEYIKILETNKAAIEKGEKLSPEDSNKFTKLGQDIEDTLRVLKDYNLKAAEDLSNQANNIYKESLRIFIVVFALGVAVFVVLASVITAMIDKSSKDMITVMSKVAEGDLTVEVNCDGENEFEIIKGYLQGTIGNILKIIEDIKQKSNNLNGASENLSAISEEMSSSADNVATAIQDVAKGSGEQAQDLVDITAILSKFGEELEAIVRLIKEVDENTREIGTMASNSNHDMENVINSAKDVENAFKDLTVKVSNVGENVKKINEITAFINNISEQTNLLALNAAIEAARAGEAGRGFSVVAEEIRKLAEQSKSSLEKINVLINSISTDTDIMVKTTGTVRSQLINQKSDVDVAIQSFVNITKAVNEVTPKINNVSTSAENIDKDKNIIIGKIEDSCAIAEEVSASAEEIAASSEQMSASTEEVSKTASTLSDMTKEILENVNVFKTE